MFTGISGSNTVEMALMIAGFNAAVLSASITSSAVVLVAGGASGGGVCMTFRFFMSFSRNRLFAVQSSLQRMPAQAGTLHPNWKLAHPGQHRQLAHVLDRLIGRGRHHRVEALKERVRSLHGLSLDRVGHQRRGRLGDRAAGSLERHVFDRVAGHLDVERQAITTERVVSLGVVTGRLDRAKVPRPLVVVEDHFLVKLVEAGHQPNTSITLRRAAPSASSSSRVLYIASDARAVAGMPSRSITGCAQ